MHDKFKSKIFYFVSLTSMCFLLILIAYIFFLREVDVDVMANVQFIYSGENGGASLKVINQTTDINQRTQEFMDSVIYEVSPSTQLSNGDIVHVKATYDANIAQQYNFHPVHQEEDFVVDGLNNRYETLEEMDPDYIKTMQTDIKKYIKKHKDAIYALDPEVKGKALLTSQEEVYSAFLKSKSMSVSDRFLQVWKLEYEQEGNITPVIYIVCVPDINDGNVVSTKDIFGERAYLSQTEIEQQDYAGYIHRVFSSQYEIEPYKK